MAKDPCFDTVKAAASDLTDEEINALIDDADFLIQNNLTDNPTKSKAQIATDLAIEELKTRRIALLLEKRNKSEAIRIKRDLNHFVENYKRNNPKRTDFDAFQAYLVGDNVQRDSIASAQQRRSEAHLGSIETKLDEEGLLDLASRDEIQNDIMREMFNDADGSSGNGQAQKIAKIFKDEQKLAVDRANRAGAFIRNRNDYIFNQSKMHDEIRLYKAGKEKFKQIANDTFDRKTMIREQRIRPKANQTLDEAFDEWLDEMFDNVVSGRRFDFSKGADDGIAAAFKGGTRNIAKFVSQDRKVIFKDAESAIRYHDEFGEGSVTENVLQGIDALASRTALMERATTNPQQFFDRFTQEKFNELSRSGDEKVAKSGQKLRNSRILRGMMKEVTGANKVVSNPTFARGAQAVRRIQDMASLGGAVISSFPDVVTFSAEANFNGVSLLGAYGLQIRRSVAGLSSDKQKRAMRLYGIAGQSLIRNASDRFNGGGDYRGGAFTKMHRTFFRLNLLTKWTDWRKQAFVDVMSADYADHANFSFNKLSNTRQNALRANGIEDAEWDVIRKNMIDNDGDVSWIDADLAENLSDDLLRNYVSKKEGIAAKDVTGNQIRRARDAFDLMPRNLFLNAADYATPTPGARERALLSLGYDKGETAGIVLSLITQFKSFAVTYLTKGFGREFTRFGVDKRAAVIGLTHMFIGTAVAGHMANMATDVTNGREPVWNPFQNKQATLDALTRGGSAGIIGDFLWNDFSRFGSSPLENFLGPTAGDLNDFVTMIGKIGRGEFENLPKDAFKFVKGNTPFLNLFYAKEALDIILFNEIQDHLNPGYLNRQRLRLRQNDQERVLPQSIFK